MNVFQAITKDYRNQVQENNRKKKKKHKKMFANKSEVWPNCYSYT